MITPEPLLTLDHAEAAAARLAPHVVRTPVVEVDGAGFGLAGARLVFKLELLQTTNAFKFRGAVNNLLSLGRDEAGVVTVSSGNHGIALAEAARRFGARALVLMGPRADAWRRDRIRALGAETEVVGDLGAAFALAAERAARDRLRFVHPYDGAATLEGTAALGLEFEAQAGPLDAVVLPVGGGGLAAGTAFALHARRPDLPVYGVEPDGAPTLTRALAAGGPTPLQTMATVADSLAAPVAAPGSFALCRRHLKEVLLMDDEATIQAMRAIHEVLRQPVEPSAAISTAAVLGPLRGRLQGARIGLILCGANLAPARFLALLQAAGEPLDAAA